MSFEKFAFYRFTSPIAQVHIITHNLNTLEPVIATLDISTGERVFGTELVLNANQVQVSFFTPVAIRGLVV